jgi:carbamoyl-phosphate synthase large subunit
VSKPVSILFSSAGRRVELMRCFRDAAAGLGCEARVLATDARPELSSACQLADASFTVPLCASDAFIPAVREICRRERVDLLVPTIDLELAAFARERESFATTGTDVWVSDSEVIGIARNKRETSRFFERAGCRTPRTAMLGEVLADPSTWQFPVVVKPLAGSSSEGFQVVPSLEVLRALRLNTDETVVQSRILGKEYTVNIFFDDAGLRCAIPHRRIETRAGEVAKAATEKVEALATAAEKVGLALAGKAKGPLCFQAIVSEDGDPHLIELNARFGGGYPLAQRAGANFARWMLEAHLGLPSSACDAWEDGLTMLRYDAACFIAAESREPRQDTGRDSTARRQ